MIFDRLLGALFGGNKPETVADFSVCYAPVCEIADQVDLAIVSPRAEVRGDLTRCYAYLSFTEIAVEDSFASRIPTEIIFRRNPRWNTFLVNIAHERWQDLLLAELRAALDLGYRNFFLDTVDGIDEMIDAEPVRQHPIYRSAVALFRRLEAEIPGRIIMNRGFTLYPDVKSQLAGVLVESYFFRKEGNAWLRRTRREMAWLAERIERVLADGKFVLALDYATLPPDEVAEYRARARAAGIAWILRHEDLQ